MLQTRMRPALTLGGVGELFRGSSQCAAPNHTLEPTPYSLRFASASGRGSLPAFGVTEML
jgi:hypothetical protein